MINKKLTSDLYHLLKIISIIRLEHVLATSLRRHNGPNPRVLKLKYADPLHFTHSSPRPCNSGIVFCESRSEDESCGCLSPRRHRRQPQPLRRWYQIHPWIRSNSLPFSYLSRFHFGDPCFLLVVGAEAEDKRINHFLVEVKGKDITELIAAGREKFASVPSGGAVAAIAVAAPGSGGAGGAGGAPAAEEPKKEEKVEEKEESDEVKLPVLPPPNLRSRHKFMDFYLIAGYGLQFVRLMELVVALDPWWLI